MFLYCKLTFQGTNGTPSEILASINMVIAAVSMKKHWTERMFVDNPSLFAARLEGLVEQAEAEVDGLLNIFSEHQVPSGGLVLDLACGIGRHSVLLAEKGFEVVGVDISPSFIARAKELASEAGVGELVDFRVGDMRRVGELLDAFEGRFDAVINLFTSMGFWDEGTDRRILAQLLELTAPNGVFIIDIVNRDWLVRVFQARDFSQDEDGVFQLVDRRLDLESSRMYNVWKYYRERDGDLAHLETIELDHRVYSLHELKRLVEDSGWTYKTCYGSFGQEPFAMDSNRMVLVARKLP